MRLILIFLLLGLAACKTHLESAPTSQPTNNQSLSTQSNQAPSIEPKTIETLLSLPADFKPVYRIVDIKNENAENVIRYTASVSLPAGLKNQEAEQNFKHAILMIYNFEKKPDAIKIFGYQDGDNIKQPNTVGTAEFAPDGKWENAAEGRGSLENFQTTIKLKDSYLNAGSLISIGSTITLNNHQPATAKHKNVSAVNVWSNYKSRDGSNLLFQVPNRTKAKILEIQRVTVTDYVLMVYLVKVNKKIGWVDSIDVKEYQDSKK